VALQTALSGAPAFEALPVAIRNLGPWTGSKEGEVGHLRLPLCSLLIDQGFVIVYAHVSKLNIENSIGTHGLHPANVECPDCKGTGQVDQHGGLRQKSCWRCAGRGWFASQMKPAIPPNAFMKQQERKELATQWTCLVFPYGN